MKKLSALSGGPATNSIVLALVQCLTILTGLVQTMILSRALTTSVYGTYSQGLLIVNFTAPLLLLGLANGITYFSSQQDIPKNVFLNTLFSLVCGLGLLGAAVILAGRRFIASYFGNEALIALVPIVALRPMLYNLVTCFQTLYIAHDMTRSIAVRNLIVSVLQVAIVCVGVYVYQDIAVIFGLLIMMDVIQVIVFSAYFRKNRFAIRLVRPQRDVMRKIFRYSIPLAVSTMVGTLSIYMDKLLIGNLMTVEDFALYSNMAKELPFVFIVNSFTTVLTPVLIKYHAMGRDDQLISTWKKYLQLGYYVNWTLSSAAIVCSPDLLVVLYSEKYSQGLPIFIVYLVITGMRFTYFGMVLSAFGKTKIIMYSSMITLAANFILNYVFFHIWGMIGPALASLVVMLAMAALQLFFSCRLLKIGISDLFDWKDMLLFLGELAGLGVLFFFARSHTPLPAVPSLILYGAAYVLIIGLLIRKRLFSLIREMNSFR